MNPNTIRATRSIVQRAYSDIARLPQDDPAVRRTFDALIDLSRELHAEIEGPELRLVACGIERRMG